jgi:hypothetical protein
LFTNQQWKGLEDIVPTKVLYERVITLIDTMINSEYPLRGDDTFIITDINKVKEIVGLYYKYLEVIPHESKTSFLSFSWRNTSSGENALLDLYSRLFYSMNEKIKRREGENQKPFEYLYILIDEGELGFHPQWQKEYLLKLLDFINQLFKGYKVQLFLTSHSPFLVSDLPKTNLIFLERDNDKTKVTDPGIEETFAGNIHELFTNKFFIKDDVTGAFAHYKIKQELVDIISNQFPLRNIERVKTFISILGEPVLKKQLFEMLKKKGG